MMAFIAKAAELLFLILGGLSFLGIVFMLGLVVYFHVEQRRNRRAAMSGGGLRFAGRGRQEFWGA